MRPVPDAMQKSAFLLFLFVFSAFTAAFAQTATVRGRVVDGVDQSPLVGANVVLTHLPDARKLGTAVDATGSFVIDDVPTGSYQLTVSFLGYQNMTRQLEVT